MSFSQDVKNEILRHRISKPCCSVAAAYAVACFGKYFDDRGIVLQTENEGVAAFAQKLYRRCGIRGDVLRKERPTGPVFEFSVKDVVEVTVAMLLSWLLKVRLWLAEAGDTLPVMVLEDPGLSTT